MNKRTHRAQRAVVAIVTRDSKKSTNRLVKKKRPNKPKKIIIKPK